MNLLRKVPLFANLKDEDKVCIEETEEWRLPAGEMLVEEAEPAEHFFVLLEGEISVAWKVAPTLVGAGLEMSALISLRDSAKERFQRRLAVDRLAAEDTNAA